MGFWNVRNNLLSIDVLSELVVEHCLDVIAVAESPISSEELALELSLSTGFQFSSDIVSQSSRITWAFKSSVTATPIFDGDKVSIREIQPPLGENLLLCAIHASSRMARDVAELNVLMPRAAAAVISAERTRGHDRTIVLGDFNLSPFDDGIISSESFHGVMSRKTAERISRTVYEKDRKFFYNPMWKFFAADDPVCGTYHFSSNNPLEYFWHIYDQIIFRPILIKNLSEPPVLVIQKTKSYQLIDHNGYPSVSDHLPILAKLIHRK